VLVAGGGVGVSRNAGDSTGRNAALSDFVPLVTPVAVCLWSSNQFSTIDHRCEVQVLGINAQPALGEQQVTENDAGALEAIDAVEDFGADFEAVSNVKRARNNARIIAESRTQYLPEITLLGLCRDTG
jgi:hypothetical protein